MNVTDEDMNDDALAQPERASPGRLLKAAREAMRLSAEDVARDLRLASVRVEALEADDYRNMPAATFVRGYLRSYARLVRLPEDEVLAAYDEIQKPRVAPIAEAPKPVPSVRRQVRSDDRPVRAVTYLLVAIVVALVFSWWKGRWEMPVAPRPEDTSAPASPGEYAAPAPVPVTAATEPGAMTTVLATPPAAGAPPDSAAKAATGTAEAPPGSAQKEAKPAPVETAKIASETLKPPADTKPGAPAPAAPPPAVPENAVQVSLVFDGSSWADVRDARGKRLVYQQFQAGQSVTVSGVPPFKVYLSNARAVRMRYAGEPYDVSAHQTGIYARFAVGKAVQ